ncbi:hypothetical protein [Waltera sp.]|uniref:hypothetical protein n=1 Tax=Waltera sp. TaxID=2815806 RepID=UPI00307A40A0
MKITILNGGHRSIELPLSDEELNFQMRQMGIRETIPKGKLVKVSEKDNPLQKLEGQFLNMDEVNFFARRMEHLTEYERKVLAVYVNDCDVSTIKDLINLTFSMKGLSLLTDFSDASQVGVRLYTDEFSEIPEEQMDFTEFAKNALKESNVKVLPYGVLVDHGFELLEVYNGKTFPKFIVPEETVVVVEVQNTTGDREYLYLPTDICSMDKVKERLQVREYREMKVTEVKNLRLPDTLVSIPEDINEIQQLTLFNEMCRKVRRFQEAELKQLATAVQFTGLINFSNVAYIATHLNEFEINPTVHNDEEYGKYLITESGLFEVDELLLPHINYAAFGADKKAGTFEVSGYVDDGFVGVTRPIEEYSQYKGEFADPLEITEEGLEKFCLFSPLIANLNMRGIAEGELYGSDLVQYLEIIEEAIERENCEGEEARGLMHYFDESREVAAKVVSAHPKVADVDGELYGVLECKIRDPLTEEEIKILKDFWTGQMSDGWGEGFEQQPLTVEDGEIYISFWSRKSFWSVMTERELIGEQQVQNTETQMHM